MLFWSAVQNYLVKILNLPFGYISSTNPFHFWPTISLLSTNINYDQNNSDENISYRLVTLKKTHNKDETQKKMSLFSQKNNHILLLQKRTREKQKEN